MTIPRTFYPMWLWAVGLALVSLAFSAAPAFACGGVVLCVDEDAPGPSHDGASWATAYTTLQDALAVAAAGNEIWVAEGVYYPDEGGGQTAGNQAASFFLKTGVGIYGGFSGGETLRTQRDWDAHITVLSGDLAGNDTTDAHGVTLNWSDVVGADNTYQVVTGGYYNWSGGSDVTVDATAVLDGFTITAGLDLRDAILQGIGAGLLTYKSNPTVSHLVFSGNKALSGGGVYLWEGTGIAMTDITFTGNVATVGGGLYCRDASLTIDEFLFQDNETKNLSAAAQAGGGMAANCDLTLTRGQFVGNTAGSAGGLSTNGGPVSLSQVIFDGNQATETNAGAGGMTSEAGSPELTDVTFVNNSSNGWGGGYYHQNSSLSLTRVSFTNNKTTWAYGGGVAVVNGVTTVTHALFAGNVAAGGLGSGMLVQGQSLTMTNAVFQGNGSDALTLYNGASATLRNVTAAGNGGQGVSLVSATDLQVSNSIIYGNGGGMPGGSGVSIAYSLVGGGCPSGAACDHVINTNPLFVSPVLPANAPTSTGDLRLSVTSPAIDAGDNSAVPAGVTTDLDGNPRKADVLIVTDTGSGASPIVDLGAYEQPGNPDLEISQTNDVSGAAAIGAPFHWRLTVRNSGGNAATFPSNTTVLQDDLPSANVSYGSPSVQDSTGLSGPLTCTVSAYTLICRANGGAVTLAPAGQFTVDVPVTTSGAPTLTNPRSGGVCKIDPNNVISEQVESNNACNSDTVTVGNLAATVTLSNLTQAYDGDPKAVSVSTTPSGLNVSVTYDGLSTVPTNAGSYAVSATVNTTGYQGSATGTLEIEPRSLTVTADAKSKVYGEPDPTLTYQITDGSLVAGDDLTGALTRATGETANVYAIQQGTLTAGGNYALSFVGANLTILSATATVTLSNLTQAYDGDPKPVSVSTTPSGLNVSVTYDGLSTVPTNAGSYAVAATVNSSDYQGSATGTLEIEPRSLIVTADAKSKVYGAPDPALTYQITDGSLVTGDDLTGALARATGETVNGYAIQRGTLTAGGNYALSFVGADLTILPADTTLALSSSLNPATVGDLITFTAQVAVMEPGAGAPTGAVTFTLDGAQIVRALDATGAATYSTSALAEGEHSFVAAYGGDDNFNGGVSTPIAQVVNLPPVVYSYWYYIPIFLSAEESADPLHP